MPLHDRRTMEGVYSVAQTAQMIRQYRYAEEQMMRIMAGWIALTPELVVKLEFGRQVWDCACAEDPAARVAGVNRGLDGLACDVFAQLIQLAHKLGDSIIERAVDFVPADEITHVRMGSTWMRKLTEDDPARRQMALDFQHHIDELFNFGGARQDGPADQVSISISREARQMAGFTDAEIDHMVQAASASVAY